MSVVPPIDAPARKSFAEVAAAANKSIAPKRKPGHGQNDNPLPNGHRDPQDARGVVSEIAMEGPEVLGHSEKLPGRGAPAHLDQLNELLKAVSLGNAQVAGLNMLDHPNRKDNSDTKSVTSRTTLTLDEKESLRPDDSASMQAAVDDDGHSAHGFVAVGPCFGSNQDLRAFRDQLHGMHRTGTAEIMPPLPLSLQDNITPEQRNGGIIYPNQSSARAFQPMTTGEILPSRGLTGGLIIPPDEKLIEALQSPKDRLFVLKIEQDMIDFVKDSKEDYLQLPQTNSFYRMLSHKLADYYLLGHLIDDSMTSVRIYRTPHCRLPPPLISPEPTINDSTPPPSTPMRKIMRRGGHEPFERRGRPGSKPVPSPLSPSLANSEMDGGSGSEEERGAVNLKASLTREERESRYKEARARIFKDFKDVKDETPEIVAGSHGKDDKDISRASSSSEVKKSKKSRKPKDDGFEARSAYSQYCAQSFSTKTYAQPMPNVPLYGAFANPFVIPHFGNTPQPLPAASLSHMMSQSADYTPGIHMSNYWPVQQSFQTHPVNLGMDSYPSNGIKASNEDEVAYQPYSSPNTALQTTPKIGSSALTDYGQPFHPNSDYSRWLHPEYHNEYNATTFDYNDKGIFLPPYDFQTMYPFGHLDYNRSFSEDRQYVDYQPNGSSSPPQFNPLTQAFVPAHRSSGSYYSQYHPPPTPVNASSARFSTDPSLHAQMSSTSQASGSGSQQYSHSSQGGKRADLSLSNRLPPQKPRSVQTLHSSISKWGTSATLPAKPPPPAVQSPFQLTKGSEASHHLPPNPFTMRVPPAG